MKQRVKKKTVYRRFDSDEFEKENAGALRAIFYDQHLFWSEVARYARHDKKRQKAIHYRDFSLERMKHYEQISSNKFSDKLRSILGLRGEGQ